MTKKRMHASEPMHWTEASHLLNPLRGLILSERRLVSRLNLKRDAHVLELGPGPGYFSPVIADAIPEGKLVLVDIQQEMLDMARQRIERRGITNVAYRQGDAVSIPAESGVFDLAVLAAVLGEVPDRVACLREIRRVLKSGGILSVTEFNFGDPHFIPKSEMLRLLESADFLPCSQFGRWLHYTINFRKA